MLMQELIQSQIFHLISMLLCIGVVVWLLVRRFYRSESDSVDNKIRSLNTLYISGILVFIIIELITAICMGNTKHADIMSFVSFAATLSSLILSIVAIIFTIVSGNRGESQYIKLDKTSEAVQSSLVSFTKKTANLDQTIDKFQSIANDLTNQMHDIYDKITCIEKPINEMREQVLLNKAEPVDVKKKGGEGYDNFKERVTRYINIGSFSGNLALYACVLAKDISRHFSMIDISDNEDDQAYKFGYLISASAMGIIHINVTGERVIEVTNYYDNLKELLEKSLSTFIDGIKDEKTRGVYSETLNKIKLHFA